MAKIPGRKSSSEKPAAEAAEQPASRRSPRTSPRNSVDSGKQAGSQESNHPGGKRPPNPLKQFAVGQVIEVPYLSGYVGRHSGFWNEEDEEDDNKIGLAIIAAICNDCMLVLPILYRQRTKGAIALDVVDPNRTPEPGSSDPMADTIAGEVLGVRGEWKPEPKAYVRLNFVVTIDFDEENWATFGISVLGDLHDESKALLKRRTSFVLGKMIQLSPSLQIDAFFEHTQGPSRGTHDADLHKGYAAAKKDGEDDGDDSGSDDDDGQAKKPKGKRPAGKSIKVLAEAGILPASKGTKRRASDNNDPTATKKRAGPKGSTKNNKNATPTSPAKDSGATDGGSAKPTTTEENQEKKSKPKKTDAEMTEVYQRTRELPNGNYTCQHEHDKTKCGCKCCKEGTKHPPKGYPKWKKEQEGQAAIANGTHPKGLARIKHSSQKIKNLPQKIPRGLVDEEGEGEDNDDDDQEGGGAAATQDEDNDSDLPLAEVTRSKPKSKAPAKKGSSGTRVNSAPRKASSPSKSESTHVSSGSSGSRRPSKASKKGSLSSAGGAPAGGVKKTASTSPRKGSNESSGSKRSTRSRQVAADADLHDDSTEHGASDESASEEQ